MLMAQPTTNHHRAPCRQQRPHNLRRLWHRRRRSIHHRQLHNPIVATKGTIGNKDITVVIYCYCHGAEKLTVARAKCTEGAKCAIKIGGVKANNPIVVSIDNKDITAVIYCYSKGAEKLTVARARCTEGAKCASKIGGVKANNPIVESIANKDFTAVIYCYSNGGVKLTVARARCTERLDELEANGSGRIYGAGEGAEGCGDR